MKILILGADGMIGHKIAHSLGDDFELILTSRKNISSESIGITNGKMILHNLITDSLDSLLDNTTPDIIINCVGITTRRGVEDNIAFTRLLNSELPFKLNSWVNSNSKKLIHFSTDCVFSGSKGNYHDSDLPDAQDIYGTTKAAVRLIVQTLLL